MENMEQQFESMARAGTIGKTILIGLMILLGIFMVIVPPIKSMRRRKKCRMKIACTCIALEESWRKGSRGHTVYVYTPTWKYIVNGIEYTHKGKATGKNVPMINEVRELYFDPDDPDDSYIFDKQNLETVMICGIVLAALGIAAMKYVLQLQ